MCPGTQSSAAHAAAAHISKSYEAMTDADMGATVPVQVLVPAPSIRAGAGAGAGAGVCFICSQQYSLHRGAGRGGGPRAPTLWLVGRGKWVWSEYGSVRMAEGRKSFGVRGRPRRVRHHICPSSTLRTMVLLSACRPRSPVRACRPGGLPIYCRGRLHGTARTAPITVTVCGRSRCSFRHMPRSVRISSHDGIHFPVVMLIA